jgi:hypothetical protein
VEALKSHEARMRFFANFSLLNKLFFLLLK